MPLYIPSMAPMAPAVGLNTLSPGTVASASLGRSLGDLSGGIAEGVIARDTIDDLAAVLGKTSPEIADILRAQSSSVPLFGSHSSGGGAGGRGGGVGGSGLDAVSFALRSIQSAQEHQQRVALEQLEYNNSLGYLGAQFEKSASLKALDFTYGGLEDERRFGHDEDMAALEAEQNRLDRELRDKLGRLDFYGRRRTAEAAENVARIRGQNSTEAATDILGILNNSEIPQNFRRTVGEAFLLRKENGGGFTAEQVAEMPDGEVYNRVTGIIEGGGSAGAEPYRAGSTIEQLRQRGQER